MPIMTSAEMDELVDEFHESEEAKKLEEELVGQIFSGKVGPDEVGELIADVTAAFCTWYRERKAAI